MDIPSLTVDRVRQALLSHEVSAVELTAAALANAPQPGAGYFKVPKVIER